MAGRLRLWAAAALLLLCGGRGGPVGAAAGRVLGLFYFPGRSHFVVHETLLKELAARGHQVDVVSYFPQKTPLPNYKDISLQDNTLTAGDVFSVQDALNHGLFKLTHFLWEDNAELCRKAMEDPALRALARSRERYDVVLLEVFGVDCAYGYAHKLGAPIVGITTLIGLPWGQERVGNPDNPAFVPVAFLPYSSRMTLWQRTVNAAVKLYTTWGEKIRGRRITDEMLREHLGPAVPPLSQLLRNTSLVMVNSHFSLNGARPTVPGYVEVGGMHVRPRPEPLPEELAAFLGGAGPAGAVLVSFGSLVRAETMPRPQLHAFVEALGALPQRVVWRVDPAAVPGGLPPNVLGRAWLPQQALLAHPNMRAFVMHGGLGSTQEAVHWGVPMVVVPFFTDQHQNGNLLKERGVARVLQFTDLTAESLGQALDAVLTDPRYRERARELSRLFRDRPQTPLQTAVYWTEYVMRHRGAPHLRSPAVQLAWYELWLLDVAAALLALASLLAAALWLAARALAEWRGRLQDASRQPWISISNGKSNPRLNGSNRLNGHNRKEKVH